MYCAEITTATPHKNPLRRKGRDSWPPSWSASKICFAKQVTVQLVEADRKWELTVEDDGAGFPFAGKISQAELDSSGRVPAIIRERVRLIQGELTIESKPGGGARLEILVPQAELVS